MHIFFFFRRWWSTVGTITCDTHGVKTNWDPFRREVTVPASSGPQIWARPSSMDSTLFTSWVFMMSLSRDATGLLRIWTSISWVLACFCYFRYLLSAWRIYAEITSVHSAHYMSFSKLYVSYKRDTLHKKHF